MERLTLELIFYRFPTFQKLLPSNSQIRRHCLLSTMEEDRGPVLTFNVLIFGIVTLCFVTVRISFRLYTRKTSASDWLLAVALVSRSLPPNFHKKDIQGPIASVHPQLGLIML